MSLQDENKNLIASHPTPASAHETVEHFRLWLAQKFEPGDVIWVEGEYFQDIDAALQAVQQRL